jgi:hypothetical protein
MEAKKEAKTVMGTAAEKKRTQPEQAAGLSQAFVR